jgi:putative glycerol-1-phosphate prenyltransferase
MKDIYKQIIKRKKQKLKSLAILLDPDKIKNLDKVVEKLKQLKPQYIFIGGSLLSVNQLNKIIQHLKKNISIPIILFPGNYTQISPHADALLFLSLISGRNPEYLIGQHVIAAPLIAQTSLEVIPTGYILVENGKTTSVEYISHTKPIPRDKKDIALATALAGEMLGLKMIYLEAGSGASKAVPPKMIQFLAKNIQIPIIVGGGIKNKKQIKKAFEAGADIVVVGTAFEENKF